MKNKSAASRPLEQVHICKEILDFLGNTKILYLWENNSEKYLLFLQNDAFREPKSKLSLHWG